MTKLLRIIITFAIILVVSFIAYPKGLRSLPEAAQVAPSYTITIVGANVAYDGGVISLNNVGLVTSNDDNAEAYIYNLVTGVRTRIGKLPYGFYSRSRGINNLGHVAGYGDERVYGGDYFIFAVLYSGQGLSNLGIGEAAAVNDNDQVVGSDFIWQEGTRTALPTLGGLDSGGSRSSYGVDINNAGYIAGTSHALNGSPHAFLAKGFNITDLGVLGSYPSPTNPDNPYYEYSLARGMNESNQVVGWSTVNEGGDHAFLYSEGMMLDLGTLGGRFSKAFAINNLGQVVGTSDLVLGPHAFLYDQVNGLQDLNEYIPNYPGWRLDQATDINDAGQIAVIAFFNRQNYPVVLTPSPDLLARNLAAVVKTFSLPKGLETSLLTKLRRGPDCRLIDVFLNEVRAQSGKGMTPLQAEQLSYIAKLIRSTCP